ncbi:hypothetical protein [Kitasatospora sp. NPDC057738]|uniref:hypothetical protein n=1 Tax=Kitasatospora sp. NPDC057738 TaxID=3346233 RepID=UPI0036A2B848
MKVNARVPYGGRAVVAVGLAALVVAGCGGPGSSPASTGSAGQPSAPATVSPSAAAPSTASATTAEASAVPPSGTPGTAPGASGGSSLTLSAANGGSYRFGSVVCVGEDSPTGALTLTATTMGAKDARAELVLGDGEARLLLALKGFRPVLWKGEVPIGQRASRTAGGARLTAMPVTEELGDTGTVTGTLTCSGAVGVH